MLEEAGIEFRVQAADVDDGRLKPGKAPVTPETWVMAMANLKARRVQRLLHSKSIVQGTVLGADTVCAHAGEMLGQARTAEEAEAMIRKLRNAVHRTLTGVCLINLTSGERSLWWDAAEVRMGFVKDQEIAAYAASGAWQGKAGAYNLSERLEAGWPIECKGDPATVMGLPMQRLRTVLSED